MEGKRNHARGVGKGRVDVTCRELCVVEEIAGYGLVDLRRAFRRRIQHIDEVRKILALPGHEGRGVLRLVASPRCHCGNRLADVVNSISSEGRPLRRLVGRRFRAGEHGLDDPLEIGRRKHPLDPGRS